MDCTEMKEKILKDLHKLRPYPENYPAVADPSIDIVESFEKATKEYQQFLKENKVENDRIFKEWEKENVEIQEIIEVMRKEMETVERIPKPKHRMLDDFGFELNVPIEEPVKRMTTHHPELYKQDRPLPPHPMFQGETLRDSILYDLIVAGDVVEDYEKEEPVPMPVDDKFDDDFFDWRSKEERREDRRKKLEQKKLESDDLDEKDRKQLPAKPKKKTHKAKAYDTKLFYQESDSYILRNWGMPSKQKVESYFYYPSNENEFSEQFPEYFEFFPDDEVLEKHIESDKTIHESDLIIDYLSDVDYLNDGNDETRDGKQYWSMREDKKLRDLYDEVFDKSELIHKQEQYSTRDNEPPFYTRCVDFYGNFIDESVHGECVVKPKIAGEDEPVGDEVTELLSDDEITKRIQSNDEELKDLIQDLVHEVFSPLVECHGQHVSYSKVNRNLLFRDEHLKLLSMPPHKAKRFEAELIENAFTRTTMHSAQCMGCLKPKTKSKYMMTRDCLEYETDPRMVTTQEVATYGLCHVTETCKLFCNFTSMYDEN